ncbi:N-myc-interactor isoform X2 [Tachyglossus aculeatus]|uniref:N-myc-interactor isoform X2 n=1 Tax=Tachyglossus aculeatus TaxID=9261 RepID=UPI0018F73482|nr:N-myc-interactor isoform X2 [Tachyglossus aculeatus]XP_038607521.1 N-myc-interactor isoform X2 [Tachyglossus aculeatus]
MDSTDPESLKPVRDEKVAVAEREKSQLLLEKLTADEEKKKAEQELAELEEEIKGCKERPHQEEKQRANDKTGQQKLERQSCGTDLQKNKVDLQIKEDIPEKDMKFTSFEISKDDKRVLDISCLFQVRAQIPYELEEGQALITFEAEEVAQNMIKKGKHLVNLENGTVELEAKPVPLKTGVTFQVHVTVSQKKINVSNIPKLLPREQMRDKLELSFCKSRKGGGEVKSVDYDPRSQTAVITFLEAGVTENILRNKVYPLKTNENCYEVTVSPYTETRLEKFQVFEGISRRTILLTGLKDIQEEEEDLEDLIHIHFQKERNGGGEVEVVKCALKRPLTVYFEEDTQESV